MKRPTVPKREMTAAEFRRTRPDLGVKGTRPGASQGPSRPGKGHAWVRTAAAQDRTADGIRFASRAEMTRYLELKAQRQDGVRFIRQPVFDLAGVLYRADFLVWTETVGRNTGGLAGLAATIHAEDVKAPHGELLRRFKRNAAQVYALYGVRVVLVEA